MKFEPVCFLINSSMNFEVKAVSIIYMVISEKKSSYAVFNVRSWCMPPQKSAKYTDTEDLKNS
jgi:hypothetical protein